MAVSFVQRRRRQIMALGALACLLAAVFVQGRIEGSRVIIDYTFHSQ